MVHCVRILTLIIFLLTGSVVPAVEIEPDATIMIPMRDGTELPADLYFPEDYTEGQKLPCILMRSTAGRKSYPWRNYANLKKHGYLVAIQDTRSAADKEGKSIPFWADGWGAEKDGYDTVEWLAKSPYTDGNIGTIGFSALGITQLMMAPSAPPSLKCQYIGVAAGSIYHHAAYPGGQLLKNQVEGWLGAHARDPSILSYFCNNPRYNDFWRNFDSVAMAHEVDTPAIHYGGWYDIFIQGTLDSFVARQERGKEKARGKQKLLIGPWTHFWPYEKSLGDFSVPENALEMPVAYSPKRWFDHYLKGAENKIEDLPAVTYYVMGPFDGSPSSGNVWKTADHWPVPSQKTPFYLTEDKKLSSRKPTKTQTFPYTYDPENPVPTIGGRNLFLPSGPKDQKEIESRGDILVFTSDPLNEDLEITGHLLATLYFASDCPDTDVAVRFCDVYPDGRSVLIADSIFRTGTLHLGWNPTVLHDPKNAIAVELDLWSTSIVIARGHSLRVTIASSNYPRFERNSNRGILVKNSERPVKAHNTIFTGPSYPSHITLPIVVP